MGSNPVEPEFLSGFNLRTVKVVLISVMINHAKIKGFPTLLAN